MNNCKCHVSVVDVLLPKLKLSRVIKLLIFQNSVVLDFNPKAVRDIKINTHKT